MSYFVPEDDSCPFCQQPCGNLHAGGLCELEAYYQDDPRATAELPAVSDADLAAAWLADMAVGR